jgi:hypothetical protein
LILLFGLGLKLLIDSSQPYIVGIDFDRRSEPVARRAFALKLLSELKPLRLQ